MKTILFLAGTLMTVSFFLGLALAASLTASVSPSMAGVFSKDCAGVTSSTFTVIPAASVKDPNGATFTCGSVTYICTTWNLTSTVGTGMRCWTP